MEYIQIRGARQHNLKNLNLNIPKGLLTVITGPSGCGKSSLAFHTIYAEGQRRYLESLGASAQKLIHSFEKPKYNFIDGLNPTIALEQTSNKPSLSVSVGMKTGIHEYLGLLFASLGVPHDPTTGAPLEKVTSPEIVSKLSNLPQKTKLILLAPISESLIHDLVSLKDDLRRQGFARVCVGTQVYSIDEPWPPLSNLSVVIDRVAVREGVESRLADSIEIALRISPLGLKVMIQEVGSNDWALRDFNTGFYNPQTGFHLHKFDASCFNYYSKSSNCPTCQGSGRAKGSLACEACHGDRLKPEYAGVTLEFSPKRLFTLPQILSLPIRQLLEILPQLQVTDSLQEVIEELVAKICKRLEFLIKIGLGALTLDQRARELSAGEFQRLRISAQLGTGLSGVIYIIDEPSRGLHKEDLHKLIQSLYALRDAGNTLIMVEHHPLLIQASDWLIDLGPEAGENGGKILAEGSVTELKKNGLSPTFHWISQLEKKGVTRKEDPTEGEKITLCDITLHNLDIPEVSFPVGAFSVVEGPSGAGKSSLVTHTLAKYAQSLLHHKKPLHEIAQIEGLEVFDRIVLVDEFSIGRSVRSSPVTFTGILDRLRVIYANLPLSKERGYQTNRFSYNVKGGRCEKCLGLGKIKLEVHLLSDSHITCDICHGKRYNNETLEVRFKGWNISEVLQASVAENLIHFSKNPTLSHALQCLNTVGLGYLKLGQPAHTLSGGESQRIKLATELMKSRDEKLSKGRTTSSLYILDEPTLGLYFSDIETLAEALRSLLVGENTIIAVSHNDQLSSYADHIVTIREGKVVAH